MFSLLACLFWINLPSKTPQSHATTILTQGDVAVDQRCKALVESVGKKVDRFRADSASDRADLINTLEGGRAICGA
ncbi:MAG: hypothetical protein M1509_07785 [Nitrospirae bacterium]|nr:hypothetical protein [Nitrospirota bacterium]